MDSSLRTQVVEEAPTAGDLVIAVENGEPDEMRRRVQQLSQKDFIQVLRAVQTVEKALSDYALSWQNSQFWGVGVDFPDEAQAKAA